MSAQVKSVVVATPDIVGRRMAGPGARAWHMAHELARSFPTKLVAVFDESFEGTASDSAGSPALPASGMDGALEMIRWSSPAAMEALRAADVVIGQPSRALLSIPKGRVVYDLFDPIVLELAELYGSHPTLRERLHLGAEWMRLRRALAGGDALICGFAAQRDFYAGVHAAASGKTDRWSERWLEVPFGVDATIAAGEAISQQGPPVIVWSGGIWEWLEPELAIEAVRRVNASGVACRLLFLGVARPGATSSLAGRVARLERAIDEAGPLILATGGFQGDRALVEEHIAPAGDVYQAGTLSGNPLAVAAALAALTVPSALAPLSPTMKKISVSPRIPMSSRESTSRPTWWSVCSMKPA